MKAEIILFIMIAIDWTGHVIEALHLNKFLMFEIYVSLIRFIGYDIFWVGYWGIALILAFHIIRKASREDDPN